MKTKHLLLLTLAILIANSSNAQFAVGTYSYVNASTPKNSWGNVFNWLVWDGTSWQTPSSAPSSSSDVIIDVDNILAVAPAVTGVNANNRLVIETSAACKTFSITGTAINKGIRFASLQELNIYGNFDLSGATKFAIEGSFAPTLAPTTGNGIINLRGINITTPWAINTNSNNIAVGTIYTYGNYQLNSDFIQAPMESAGPRTCLFFYSGTFKTNGYSLSTFSINDRIVYGTATTGRVLDISNSTLNLGCFYVTDGPAIDLISNANSHIFISDTTFASTGVSIANGSSFVYPDTKDNLAIKNSSITTIGSINFYHDPNKLFLAGNSVTEYVCGVYAAPLLVNTNYNLALGSAAMSISTLQVTAPAVINFFSGNTFTINTIKVPNNCNNMVHFTARLTRALNSYTSFNNSTCKLNITTPQVLGYTLWNNVNVSGAGITANNSFDLGGNVGNITINNGSTPRTLAWCGSVDNNWNNSNNWRLASGGGCGVCLPTMLDSVVFDPIYLSGVATKTVDVKSNSYCKGMAINYLTSSPLSIIGSGNLYNSSGLWVGYSGGIANTTKKGIDMSIFKGDLYFVSNKQSNMIATQGATIGTGLNSYALNTLFFYGGGKWIIKDDLNATYSGIYINDAHIKFGNTKVTIQTLGLFSNTVTTTPARHQNTIVDLDNCTLTINGQNSGHVYSSGFSLGMYNPSKRLFINGGQSTVNIVSGVFAYKYNYIDIGLKLDTLNNRSINFWNVQINNSNVTGSEHHVRLYANHQSNAFFIHKLTLNSPIRFDPTSFVNTSADSYLEVDTLDVSGGYSTLLAPKNKGLLTFSLKVNKKIIADVGCGLPYGKINSINDTIPANITVPSNFGATKLIVNNVLINNGTGTLTASNSVLTGSTTGWVTTATAGKKFYWNGEASNTNWSNPRNWNVNALAHPTATDDAVYNLSNCIPSPFDSVFFSNNAFPVTQTVTLDDIGNNAKTITWNLTDKPDNSITWNSLPNSQLNIYESLILNKKPVPSYNAQTWFYGASNNNVIKSSSRVFGGILLIDASGVYTLQDSLTINATKYGMSDFSGLILAGGDIKTNGNNMNLGYFHSAITTNRSVNIKKSRIIVRSTTNLPYVKASSTFIGPWALNSTNATLLADSSHIYIGSYYITAATQYANNAMLNLGANPVHYNRVTFYNKTASPSSVGDLFSRTDNICHFNKVNFLTSDTRIVGSNQIDTLLYAAMSTNELEAGKTQSIDSLRAISNNCQNLILRSSQTGSYTYLCDIGTTKRMSTTFGDVIDVKSDACAGYTTPNQAYNSGITNSPGWQVNSTAFAFGFPSNTYTLNCKNGPAPLSSAGFYAGATSTYSWSSGASTPNYTATQNGTYSLTVTYKPGCAFTDAIAVTYFNTMLGTKTVTPVSCNGYTNGAVAFTLTAGNNTNHTYSYIWNTGLNNDTLKNVSAGVYTITVTDSTASSVNCKYTQTVSVTQPSALSISSISTNTVKCFGASTGSITTSITGGNGGYMYNWTNGTNTYTTQNINNINSGTYSLMVTDSKSCTATTTLSVNQPTAALSIMSATAGVVGCGLSNGTATLTIVGGTPTYVFNWQAPSSNSYTTNVAATNSLALGINTVTITDANGCATSTLLSLQSATSPTVQSVISNVLCNNGNNGAITTSVTASSAYSYLWSNGMTTGGINNLTAGFYSLAVTDGNNCKTIHTVTITEPSAIIVSEVSNMVSCDNAPTGGVSLAIQGGTPTYSVTWFNGDSGTNATNLPPGIATTTVTDNNGCVVSFSTQINEEKCLITLIPQLFSPNGDGKNDVLYINTINYFPNNKLEIYNRWGSLVYSKDKYDNTFNGKASVSNAMGNGLLPVGTYFVVFDFGDGKTAVYKGYLELKY